MGLYSALRRLFGFGPDSAGGETPPGSHSPSSVEHRDFTPPVSGGPDPGSGHPARPSSLPSSPPSGPPSPHDATGLDASRFQPISQEEALDATTQPGRWGGVFDPRSEIPPATLPRIRVIDRTMVGMGLISGEELAEIHRLGELMGKFRTDYRAVQTAGTQAVQASREQREAQKAELKRLAAEKKKAHQEAVAQRKATDIIFLGRGVSQGLADRRSNIERLQASELPVLSSPADLAEALGISIGTLRWLAFHHPASKTTHYHSWKVAKKSGGERTISRPHKKLESAQRWILAEILSKRPTHEAAHGFVPGRSTLSGAVPHVGSQQAALGEIEK
jgi:RNA-directed DNA polymerase